jgi:DNA-binding beta-propeller fold protein YncE
MFQRYFLAPLAALLLLAAAPRLTHAQTGAVGIGTTAPDASAALDIVSSSKGVLLPRVTNATSITSPAPGLLVYQTGGTAGFYYNAGTAAAPSWQRLSPGDNLGNHTATQALNLNGQKLTGGGPNGLRVRSGGGVRIDTLAGTGSGRLLTVAPDGTLQASAPIQSQALASTAPAPQLVGSATTGRNPVDVAMNAAGTRAYVINSNSNNNNSTLQVFDVSGSTPVSLGTAPTGFGPGRVVLNGAGTRAYVVNSDNTLQIFDISGSTPMLLGATATGSSPRDVAVNAAGTRAYVVNLIDNTLQAYDVSGNAPVALGSPVTTATSPSAVALNAAGTVAYVTTGVGFDDTIQSFDVSGSGTPVALSSTQATAAAPFKIVLNRMNTRAYVLHGSGSLQAYSLSGSNGPVALGNLVATSNARSIALNPSGTRAYVTIAPNANVPGSFQIYDLSSDTPVALGSAVATGPGPYSIALNPSGTRVYVVNSGSNALQVYSLGAAPTVVGITSDGSLGTLTQAQLADNLGNHTATQNLDLAGYQLVSGGSTGLTLTSAGNAGLGTTSPSQKLEVAGNVKITGSGNGLTFPDGSVQTSASSLSNLVGDVTSNGTTTTYNNVVPTAKGGAGTVSGILKANGSGLVSQAAAADFPLLNQSTTGNAATVTTNANLTGDVTSSGNTTSYTNVVPAAKGGAGTVSGLLKANGSGTVSAAVAGTDYLTPATAGTGFIQNTTSPQANAAFNVSGAGTVGGLLTAGSATVGGNAVVAGTLGVGTTAVAPATQALDVRGNVRLGADGGNVASTGQTIEFVGPGVNTDPVGLYRVNTAADASELRVVVGDAADANDRFVVGRTSASAEGGIPGGTFTPTFTVRSDGNVGVGTATPGQKLEVVGNVKITGSGNGLTFPDNTVQLTAVSTSGFIQNATTQQASSNFNISGTGQVGGLLTAGSATVSGPLTASTGQVSGLLTAGSATVGGKLTAGSVAASSSSAISSQGAYLQWNRTGGDGETWLLNQLGGGGANAGIRFGGATTSNGVTEWGRFLNNGNFGLGTASPGQKLDVAGNANVSGQLTASSATVSGNVGIGLSTPVGGLHIDRPEVGGVSGTLQTAALGVVLSGGSSGSPSIELRGDGKSPYIDFVEAVNNDYTTRLISQGGVLNVYGVNAGVLLNVRGGLQATSVTQTSDARFKTNVRPLGGALASVLALRGVRYEWNALGVKHGGTAGAPQVGFLAQEVEKVYPELVSTDKDGYKAVNYAQLTPVLLEAIKELAAQNEALKAAAGAANSRAASAEAKAAQATATLETFEARLRRLEASTAQAQR